MKIIHLFLLVVDLIVHLNGQCVWRGRAPFCSLSCCEGEEFELARFDDYDRYRFDQDEFGEPCWFGSKKLCCKLRSCYISGMGSSRSPSSCKNGDAQVGIYTVGVGSACRTGRQKLCFSGLPSRRVNVTLYADSNHGGAMKSYDKETHCIHVGGLNATSSVEIHGTCVRAFNSWDCDGRSISLSAGSPGHDLGERGFHGTIESIAPCLANDHLRAELINQRWDPKFLDDVVIFGRIPGLAMDDHHVKEPVQYFQTGHGGRTESMQAMISRSDLNTGSPPTTRSREYVHQLGRDGDDAGLILGAILGGSGTDERNLFPQSPHFNRDAFAHFEGMVADIVSLYGRAFYNVNLQYQGPETRPKRIFVRIEYRICRHNHVITNDFLNA